MKIKSRIDEIKCTAASISGGPYPAVTAEFGYLAKGFPVGHVEIVGVKDDNVQEKLSALIEALEEHFASLVGEPDEPVSEPVELKGLVPREF